MNDIKALDREYVANTYARFPLALVAGKGSLVYDENGKKISRLEDETPFFKKHPSQE